MSANTLRGLNSIITRIILFVNIIDETPIPLKEGNIDMFWSLTYQIDKAG